MMLLSLKTFWFLLWGLVSVQSQSALTTSDMEKLHVPNQEASTLPGDLSADDEHSTTRADGLVVMPTLKMVARMPPTFSDSPEPAGRTSHDGTTEGTKPTEGQQTFRSSPATLPISELERNSSPVFIQNHSGPGTTGRTPTDLISTPQPPEPLMSISISSRSPQNLSSPSVFETTGRTLTATGSLIATPDPPEPSTSVSITSGPSQNLSSPASFGTTGITSPDPSVFSSHSSGSSENLSRTTARTSISTRSLISTPDPPEPSTSSSITESSASSPSNSGLTSGPQPPEPPRSLSYSSSTRIPATTRSPPSTPAPCVPLKPSVEDQPCSTRSVVKPCLISIGFLAALATIFMVSTIVLCTKLSTRTYQVKRAKEEETEMMFMSALLPERNYASVRQRSPAVTNGVLVIHSLGDSDEDVSDNLTLSSFLPESDRFV
ncbi:mucin-2-like [Dunckerocampus dactyliophorus]|uniref:mucin-2-like n=1 Tax=Dunckerocampus dactyliophorus TaxID=161453 RepID=UPI002405B4E8|nr:mucin-2-like [Dunckerocampus dactyliophorus]